jgi:hypothetical protein
MIRTFQYHATVFAAYVLAGISILACGYYGFVLGQGGFEGGLYALMFACFDTVKFNLPTLAELSLAERRYAKAGVAMLLFATLCVASLFCEIGVYATTVAHNTAPKLASQERYRLETHERDELESRLKNLSAASKADAQTALNKLQQDRLYTQTDQCKNATLPESRIFCKDWEEARGKLEKATDAEALRKRLDGVKDRLAAMDLTAVTVSAMPQVDAIVATMGTLGLTISRETVPTMLAILIAALIETAAVIFWLMGAQRPAEQKQEAPAPAPAPKKAEPKPAPVALDTVSLWVEAATARSTGALAFAAIKQDYATWADANSMARVTDTKLGLRLGELGFKKEKIGGRIHYRGLRLSSGSRLKIVGGA